MDMKTAAQRVKNPTGRLDWLACALLERVVNERNQIALTVVYNEFRPKIEKALVKHLGPRKSLGKRIKRYVLDANKLLESADQRRNA